MEMDKRCPFCASPNVRLREGMLRLRNVPVVGGPGEDRNCLVYRCLACGRGFDEVEAQESPQAS